MSDASGPVESAGAEGAGEVPGAEQAEGQDTSVLGGLYDLSDVPEELRPFIGDKLKTHEGHVTKKLQEAAEYRKQWEPFEQMGVHDVPAEEMQGLLGLYQQMQTPEGLQELHQQLSEHLGTGDMDEESWLEAGKKNGWIDDGDEDEAGFDPQSFKQELMQEFQQMVNPIQENLTQRQQQEQMQQHVAELQGRMAELHQQHGDPGEEGNDFITNIAFSIATNDPTEKDPLGKAFEQYLRVTGSAEGRAVDKKLEQPERAMNGGRPSSTPEHLSWNGNGPSPKDAALARLTGGR